MQVDGTALIRVVEFVCVCVRVCVLSCGNAKFSLPENAQLARACMSQVQKKKKTEVVRGHPDRYIVYHGQRFPSLNCDTGLGWTRSAAHMACV